MSYIIKCNGIKVKSLEIPSFEMYKGEYLSLDLPVPYDVQLESEIRKLFLGESIVDQVIVNETFIAVQEPNLNYSLLDIFSRRISVYNYLSNNTSYSKVKKLQIIEGLGLNPEDKLSSLGGNYKKYIAVEVAFSHSKYLILNVLGIDPLGIEKLFHRLEQELSEGGIIELNYENSFGRIHNRYARVIEVLAEDMRNSK